MTVAEPRTNKGRATRDRVIDAASALVFEHGVAGTTLDDVRAAANVSKGQLYHYFADKEDLVHAVIDRTIQQVLDAQPALSDLSTWTAISTWFDDLVELQNARHAVGGCPIGGLAGQLAETDEQARQAGWQPPPSPRSRVGSSSPKPGAIRSSYASPSTRRTHTSAPSRRNRLPAVADHRASRSAAGPSRQLPELPCS
jgi:AcrR family transcriptional regulator